MREREATQQTSESIVTSFTQQGSRRKTDIFGHVGRDVKWAVGYSGSELRELWAGPGMLGSPGGTRGKHSGAAEGG